MRFAILIILLPLVVSQMEGFAKGVSAIILKNSRTCYVKSGGINEKVHRIIRINDKDGDRHGHFEIYYNNNSSIKKIEASIKDINGKVIRKLASKFIEDKPAISGYNLYQDDRVKTFSLLNSNYPYLIEISYEKERKDYLQIAHWIPVESRNIMCIQSELKVIASSDLKINYLQHEVDSPTVINEDGTLIYTWKKSLYQLPPYESYSPPLLESAARVLVQTESFKYGIEGSNRTWKDFGDWICNLNKGSMDLPDEEVVKLNNLVKDAKSDRDKLEKLYKYLQTSKRYVSVQIGVGGFKPFDAKYVCERGYGDCKALSNYMKSMAAAVGVQTYYAPVNAGRNAPRISIQFPAQQFNHIILYAPLKNDTVWLECTSKDLPFNYLGSFTQNRKALVVDNGNSQLVTTQVLDSNSSYRRSSHSLQLEPGGGFTTIAKIEAHGRYFELLQRTLETKKEETHDLLIHSHSIFQNLESVELVSCYQPDSTQAKLFFNYKASGKIGNRMGNKLLVRLPDFDYYVASSSSKRMNDIFLPLNKTTLDSIHIIAPVGMKVYKVPKDVNQNSEFGYYNLQYRKTHNGLLIIRKLNFVSGRFSKEKYPAFEQFYKSGKQASVEPIIFVKNE